MKIIRLARKSSSRKKLSSNDGVEPIARTPLFDADWYEERNSASLAQTGLAPAQHYLQFAHSQGMDPGPFFQSRWYLRQNPDVAAAGMNPLLHYLTHGSQERRQPSAFFDPVWYLEQNPDVVAAKIDPLIHFVEFGASEGRSPSPFFDCAWYLKRYPDVATAGINPLQHYIEHGAREGRNPAPFFDTMWYETHHGRSGEPELANSLAHFVTEGLALGYAPGPILSASQIDDYLIIKQAHAFDEQFYAERFPDVTRFGFDPLVHFVGRGAEERRDPSPEFGINRYVAEHPESGMPGVNPLVHYLRNTGKTAIRAPRAPKFSRRQDLWSVPSGTEWRTSFENRLSKRLSECRSTSLEKPFDDSKPTFSIITTVYETAPSFLADLADTIEAQLFQDFEWLILDNGSNDSATRDACQQIAKRNERFKLFRVEENLHIIGGNRYVFERAEGHYIVPVDSDDILYPDSLAMIARVLRENKADPPSLIYSDEQKVDINGKPLELIWRDDYALSQAMQTVPAAHLVVFDRELGDRVSVYSDDYARGSHDWDSILRVTESGANACHIPEVLYGWRVHDQSTAASADAKDYILGSQTDVIDASLKRRGLADQFEINSLFEGIPGWYGISRRKVPLPPIEIDLVIPPSGLGQVQLPKNLKLLSDTSGSCRVLFPAHLKQVIAEIREGFPASAVAISWQSYEGHAELTAAINEIAGETFAKFILSCEAELHFPDVLRQVVGALELDPRAGVVGGPIVHADGNLQCLGFLAGLDRFVASPFFGWPVEACPPHMIKVSRPVSGFPALALCIRGDLLRSGVTLAGVDSVDSLHGLEFCLSAIEKGFTCLLDHRLETQIEHDLQQYPGAGGSKRKQLHERFSDVLSRRSFSVHLLESGSRFGRLKAASDFAAPTLENMVALSPAIPLNLGTTATLDEHPAINVLLPAVRKESLSGGPNTALNIAYRLAARGFRIRIISTDLPIGKDLDVIWDLMLQLSGQSRRFPHVEIVDGSDRSRVLEIGSKDIFLATAWWTATMAHAASDLVGGKPFIYLIQDFEPIFYPASSHYAIALETYSFPHLPLINTALLKDYFVDNKVGLFADSGHVDRALHFEPALDRQMFFPVAAPGAQPKRRLLFYARPSVGLRNLFEIGVAALKSAVAQHVLDFMTWDIVGMGEQFSPVPLGDGATLQCAPWLGLEEYAKQMREADILLSLMLSPHPSYPPLEMAACGGLVITNTYENKTADRLNSISPNIIAVEPTVQAIVGALEDAIHRLTDVDARQGGARMSLPGSWDDSLNEILDALSGHLEQMHLPHATTAVPPVDEPVRLAIPAPGTGSAYECYLRSAAERRAKVNRGHYEPGLFSFVTTVWNTAPAYLEVLSNSLQRQVGGTTFEWLILDNGSTRTDTREFLRKLQKKRYVTLHRVEENIGIIPGMEYCLNHASGRYILPLDSDDYLYPDCLQTIAWYIEKHDYPALLYTDEDKLIGDELCMPFQKPNWDPVLFSVQCFVAHLCVIDRELALKLGAYSDRRTEGSHDWDSFSRFMIAGHVPVHIPHILYSWRLHGQSTAGGNMESKPVVFASQLAVLSRQLQASPHHDKFDLVPSPLFGRTPDWWWKRRRENGRPLTTILIHSAQRTDRVDLKMSSVLDHRVIEMHLNDGLDYLLRLVQSEKEAGRLIHTLFSEVLPDNDEWAWEAIGQLELHPDAVAVGGRIHSYRTIIDGGRILGFGDGCDSPERLRSVDDPGYSAQMWKQRSVDSVSILHAVYEPAFLREAISWAQPRGASLKNLSAWLGAFAAKRKVRIIYSPLISAATTIDIDQLVGEDEKALFRSACADLPGRSSFWHPDWGMTASTAYMPQLSSPPGTPATAGMLPNYAEWQRIREKINLSEDVEIEWHEPVPLFSLLTTVYRNTDVELFEQTMKSVMEQVFDGYEWIVLAHGTISSSLDATLKGLSDNGKVTVLRLPENLGIMGGMRHVLEAAVGRYVIPLDGDDLLAPDAMRTFAETILDQAEPPAFLYSDEDILIEHSLQLPYLRPAWDPVLDLENSWIWHLVAMDRQIALDLDVYSDRGAEYCHDWDSVDRFLAAGYRPLHVSKILYHWRHHERSTSNSGDTNSVSAASVRHVLERKIARAGMSEVVEPAAYPIWRGAKEWWLNATAAKQQLIAITDRKSSPPDHFEVRELYPDWNLETLREMVANLPPTALVVVLGQGVYFDGGLAQREVVKLFELLPEVSIACGPLVAGGTIRSGGLAINSIGQLVAPLDGKAEDFAGAYALALKPQTIAAPPAEAFFARVSFLAEALKSFPWAMPRSELGLWLGAYAAADGKRVAYSPLLKASIAVTPLYEFTPGTTELAWKFYCSIVGVKPTSPQGCAVYDPPRWY